MRTYGHFDRDELPPIGRRMDDNLEWLLREPVPTEWAIASCADSESFRGMWRETSGFIDVVLPPAFDTFVSSPEPACRIRSATGCYVEAADFVVPVVGGGCLIHFLSDQQWIRHWLLYVGDDGRDAVVSTYPPYGFIEEREPGEYDPGYDPESLRLFDPGSAEAIVCADSFTEFLYRWWIENEIFFRQREDALTPEQRRYAEHYVRPRA
jgi:hypothetical protein